MTALVVLLPVLVWTFAEFKSAKENYVLANALLDNFFERASLRDQYFLYHENRVRIEWEKNKEESDLLLRQAAVQYQREADRNTLEQLHKNIEDSAIIFHRIGNNIEVLETATDNRKVYEELDRRLSSQLLLKASTVRNLETALKDASAQRVEQTYEHLTIIIGLFSLTLAISTILTTMHLGGLIRKRLAPLHDGAKIVADGNLDFRIKREGSDELAELALSINSMTDKLTEEIIDRKHAEESLIKQKQFSDDIINSLPGIFYMLNQQGEIVRVNPQFFTVSGYSNDEINGISALVFFDEKDKCLVEQRIRESFEKGISWIEAEFITKSGQKIPYYFSGHRTIIEDRPYIVGLGTDITERKRAEQALQRESEKNLALLRNASDGIHILDAEGNIIEASDSFCTMLGYRRDEIIGMNVSKWDAGFAEAAELRTIVRQQLENPLRSQFETRHRRKDGSIFDVEVSGFALQLDGKPALFNSSRDITERKRTDNALRESESRLRVMLENDLVGIVTVRDRIIEWANPAYEKLLGYEQGELNGVPARLVFVNDEVYRSFGERAYPVINSGGVFRSELDYRRKDGSIIFVDVSGAMLNPETGESLWGVVDITARVENELELKRSNTELEQFSYAISHDMRQPLRMISSYLQLIQMSLADKLDQTNSEYFNFAIDGAKRLDQMMVGLLEYSRVGRKGDPFDWVKSRTLLDEAVLYLGPAIAEAEAILEIEGEWPRVWGSSDEIVRLMQNLIGNAVKYRVPGRSPRIRIASKVIDKKWCVSVSDNGIGINPTQIGRLFQVFQRLHSRASYDGNGVGLALARRIVEHHGGRIWAESAGEDQGSTFNFELSQGIS